MKSRGIYIHIPFCKKKCDYCDFVSYGVNNEKIDTYLDYLDKEMLLYYDEIKDSKISSVYIGGGTPSVLNIEQIRKLFFIIKKYFVFDCECTFEVNPESIDEHKLSTLRECGVNRISVGIQSINDNDLKYLGRIHNSNKVFDVLNIVSKMNFNYSIDFIYGFNKKRDIVKELNLILEYNPNHISLYPLEVYDHLKISKKIKSIDDDFAFKQYKDICKHLSLNGYEHYEISNFAKLGYESKHNSNYWRCS